MSSKTSIQPGRRTPLSLSGAVTKPNPNKGSATTTNGGSNGHTTSNINKQDSKLQQQKTEPQQTVNNTETKEISNKKQQPDKKHQDSNKKSSEKNLNGVNDNKQQQSNENKQQQQIKEKQQQNGNDNKLAEKDKKGKADKSDNLEKLHEKQEKEDTKLKEDSKQDQENQNNKKDEKKTKETKDVREDKKEAVAAKNEEKVEQQQQQIKKDNKKSKEEHQNKNAEQKTEEKLENKDVEKEQKQQQLQHKSPPVTPKTNSKANKTSTPVNKTPTKANEKTPQKSNVAVKTTSVAKREVTTAVDNNEDIEMEPLAIESSPIKSTQSGQVDHVNIAPFATSTPGKILFPKRNVTVTISDVQLAMQTGISPERPRAFSQISGRKSIRPISDYTPSKFQSNLQFRESYRRINTDLDVTNTSMNVTVGSEVPNNLSFSFFGRGRKRDRINPQNSDTAIGELQTDMEISPPKRARLDMYGFFSAVSSPLSLLRNRFSKATLQNSTTVQLQQKLNADEDEIEVQNVSGVSVHEEISNTDKETVDTNNSNNEVNNTTLGEEAKENQMKTDFITSSGGTLESKELTDDLLKCKKSCDMEKTFAQSDIKITETLLQPVVGEPMAKNKKCIIM